ncbi:MAG: DUF1573 domain-containing protein [Bacteroidaceae bacterium]|nr:DUF1573 domain-containing protein [Bacteroidaceae bacterium]MBR6602001.1 DUF1573 domain-containing protein [Bacteroidaceae bacterium]
MKKHILMAAMLLVAVAGFSQEEVKPKNKGEMKFEKTRHNFGVFAADTAVVTHEFVFTNVGKAPLIIHQANASCGCTVPEYTLEPIQPGEKGKITVTYNGKGRRPGVFRKSITIHNNGRQSPIRIYIEGEMISNEEPIKPIELIQDSTLYPSSTTDSDSQ